jgi:hypothetical protein
LKVKYSPDFAAAFQTLPAETQNKFKAIDARVAAGDLSAFRTMGWAYFIDIDETAAATGSVKEDGALFYWLLLGTAQSMPVIL